MFLLAGIPCQILPHHSSYPSSHGCEIAREVPWHTFDSWISTHSHWHGGDHHTFSAVLLLVARACQAAPVLSPSRGAGRHQDASPICRGLCPPSYSTSAWYSRGVSLALPAGRRQGKTGSNSWTFFTRAASKDSVTPGGVPTEGSYCSFTPGLSLPINAFSGLTAPTTPKASCLQSLLCIVFKYVLGP